jgi:hypothetical protein
LHCIFGLYHSKWSHIKRKALGKLHMLLNVDMPFLISLLPSTFWFLIPAHLQAHFLLVYVALAA